MSHYFTDNKDLDSNRQEFNYKFDNEEFVFTTDCGVFSKDAVDYGSYLLIKCVYQKPLGSKILDLGCGYGVIGIILSRYNPFTEVHLVDVNSRATELAKLNGKKNNVKIDVFQTDDIRSLNNNYSTITLNPPIRAGKVVMFSLYERAYDCLEKGGKLYIVIQKKHGANSSYEKLKDLFDEVTILDKVHGHWLIEAVK